MTIRLQCREVSRLISDGQDRELPAPDRARLRLHFLMCQTCRKVNRQMAFLRRAMRQLGRDEPPQR
jgi:predicted anti-sigma-YlaC factor YlaD